MSNQLLSRNFFYMQFMISFIIIIFTIVFSLHSLVTIYTCCEKQKGRHNRRFKIFHLSANCHDSPSSNYFLRLKYKIIHTIIASFSKEMRQEQPCRRRRCVLRSGQTASVPFCLMRKVSQRRLFRRDRCDSWLRSQIQRDTFSL
jgi:hypothetical protein